MVKPQPSFVAGYFTDPQQFKRVCTASTAAGHRDQQAFTPYPLHGIERCLNIKRSWIGRPVLFMLLFGAFLGFMMQLWMLKWDWPQIIGGKPFNSWPAFVVITFESGILCGALSNMAIVLLVACGLWPKSDTKMPRPSLTDDTFCLAVPAADAAAVAALQSWMAGQGAESVEVIAPPAAIPASAEVSHA